MLEFILQQAIEWSVRHSNTGAVYEIELDASQLHLKQYVTYSNKFIDTFLYM